MITNGPGAMVGSMLKIFWPYVRRAGTQWREKCQLKGPQLSGCAPSPSGRKDVSTLPMMRKDGSIDTWGVTAYWRKRSHPTVRAKRAPVEA